MTLITAEWQAPGFAPAAQSRIVTWDTDTQELTDLAVPPSGRSFIRPIVSPLGAVAWIETVAGGDVATARLDGSLWIDDVEVGRPDWVYWEHPEFSLDGTEMVHAGQRAGVDPGMRLFVTDLDLNLNRTLGDPGLVDPSWTTYLIAGSSTPVLGGDRADWFTMESTTGDYIQGPVSDEGARCYDPFISPNVAMVVWRRSTGNGVGTSGLRLKDGEDDPSWLVPPAPNVIQGPARWIDNTTLITSRRTTSETYWSLYSVSLSGVLTRLTDGDQGSLSAPVVAPGSTPPDLPPIEGLVTWGDGLSTAVLLSP